MTQRLDYIDSLKGFAILLVVMGHAIMFCFENFRDAVQMTPSPLLLWQIIYSFHMPLFMFISGYLFGGSHFTTFKAYFSKMFKKTKALIIPWFVCGVLVYMWRGVREFTYWYLLTLLLLYLLVGIENYFIDKIKNKKWQIISEIALLGTTHLGLQVFTKVYDSPMLYSLFDWFPHLRSMFGYFALGSFIMRHFDISKIMDQRAYSICLLVFCSSFYFDIDITKRLSLSLTALAGIYCSLYLFKLCFTEGKAIDYFKRIGKKTLQIYIIHLFLGIRTSQLGEYFITLSQGSRMEFMTVFVLQLIFSLVISLLTIELCIFIGKIIKTSKLFSFTLLGE